MPVPSLDKIHDAALSGIPLLLAMLASFLVGALATRYAIELDARALWDTIRRNKPAESTTAPEAEEAK